LKTQSAHVKTICISFETVAQTWWACLLSQTAQIVEYHERAAKFSRWRIQRSALRMFFLCHKIWGTKFWWKLQYMITLR